MPDSGHMEVTYETFLIDGDERSKISDNTCIMQVPAHADLIHCFKQLVPHLVFLTETMDVVEYMRYNLDDGLQDFEIRKPAMKSFTVTSISIGGTGEHEGVTITGQKKLKNKKVFNMNTPFSKYEDETDDYPFKNQLIMDVRNVLYEVEKHLGGKRAESKQIRLDFTGKDELAS